MADGRYLNGRMMYKGDVIYPMAGSLPMGFTWSLYFAQTISEAKIQKVSGLQDSTLVSDRGTAVVFRAPTPPESREMRHYVYVDNLGVISPHEAVVREAVRNMEADFSGSGLLLHPGEVESCNVKALGSSLRGDLLATRVTPKRFHGPSETEEGEWKDTRGRARTCHFLCPHQTTGI